MAYSGKCCVSRAPRRASGYEVVMRMHGESGHICLTGYASLHIHSCSNLCRNMEGAANGHVYGV